MVFMMTLPAEDMVASNSGDVTAVESKIRAWFVDDGARQSSPFSVVVSVWALLPRRETASNGPLTRMFHNGVKTYDDA